MYSVLAYGEMLHDRVRMDAYRRAIHKAVKPGDVVLDLGAGTGILSILAARAGARRVHAVDPNPAIHFLADLARENGLDDRIEVHPTSALELELPEKADVIVSDLRGSFPLNGYHAEILRDARVRLLQPNGISMPARDRLFVAAVDSTSVTSYFDQALDGYRRLGVRSDALRSSIHNTAHLDSACMLHATDVVTSAAEWAVIEYGVWNAAIAEGEGRLTPKRDAIVNALAVWFEATIFGDLGYANTPGNVTAYARIILPLIEPVPVVLGDVMNVVLRVNARGTRWAWDWEVLSERGTRKAGGRQSSFYGTPTSAAALLRASKSFRPARSARGERAARILDAMNGERTVSDIVEQLDGGGLPNDRLAEEVQELVEAFAR